MEPSVDPDRVAVSAEGAAVAALHELPGARMLVFDPELRFILPAGQTFQHDGGSESGPLRRLHDRLRLRLGL